MTAVYLFAGLLALLVAVGLLVSPLLEREPVPEDEASAAERRDQALEALREVEFEYRTGKLSEEDYRELRSRHAEAAVEARRLADREEEPRGGAGEAPGDTTAPDDASADAPAGETCPECGADIRRHARFCSRCGGALGDAGG